MLFLLLSLFFDILICVFFFFFFFFFQAEDGIRDTSVTGVQTCALPISPTNRTRSTARACSSWLTGRMPYGIGKSRPVSARSEERRVGKECRSRWAADH